MSKKLKERLEPKLKWIPIIQLIVTLISLFFIILIPVYYLPNLNQQFTHQNTVDYLKEQIRSGQNYEKVGQYKDAIEIYKKCLDKITDKEFPEEYAEINLQLGNDYSLLSKKENQIQNIQLAINSYNEAQQTTDFNFDNYPIENIVLNHNLGYNYLRMSEYSNSQINLEKAIIAFKISEKRIKEVYENKTVPGHVRIMDFQGLGYATPDEIKTKNPYFGVAYLSPYTYIFNEVDLAHAYHDLAILSNNKTYYNYSRDSLNNAFNTRISFDSEIPVSEKRDPFAYSFVLINYAEYVDGFDNQMYAYNEALQIITPQTDKELFAEIQKGIGTSYVEENPNNITNIEKSIQHYKLALAYTDKNKQFEYAKILKKLAYSYSILATYKDKDENFENAKNTYDTFFSIYTSDYPIAYADAKADIVVLYTTVKDVKNNKTDYKTAQDAFDIAKANNMFKKYPDYDSFLNSILQ